MITVLTLPVLSLSPWIPLRAASHSWSGMDIQHAHFQFSNISAFLLQPDFSQFVVTTESVTACETSRDKPASLSLSTCLIYAHGLRLPLGLRCLRSAYPPCTPYIRFLFVRLQFRYPFFSPTPHDVNLGSRYGVRRQLRPLWTFTTD